jgi:hypothetical protein
VEKYTGKMKMNWGWGIVILFATFIFLLSGFIVLSTLNRFDLVHKDYYAQELNYQRHIDRLTRSQTLEQSLTWQYDKTKQIITLNFPATIDPGKITGKIIFFRPSDAKQDSSISLQPDSHHRQQIDVHMLSSGFWRMKIFWQSESSEFFHEGQVIIEEQP